MNDLLGRNIRVRRTCFCHLQDSNPRPPCEWQGNLSKVAIKTTKQERNENLTVHSDCMTIRNVHTHC